MSNIKEIKGNWNETKEKLIHNFALLTEEDTVYVDGKQDEMMNRIQIKCGLTKEELYKVIAAI